ncbi:short-chain dehydrogenase [Marinomonas sp. CT5]|uniref:SDR family NAD(P)-dependent oxidoreductase n=1 Tax=Marinomonas sp. CT5 TaxID=2066133 RepID=UPI0018238C2B|nr:SDR family NAD(P)-dependent oxidoreductase [Marinomonas sp. CT5]NVK72801.1 SDR family NAD(P)-dependent oxidoreductase [Oceanospirillaceae bacterium]QUX94647.1 short-chain dehydrogenase [Marinomonas sp. CT5]
MPSFYALVIGASSAIAQAAIQQFEADQNCLGVFAVTRSTLSTANTTKTQWLTSDYTEESIQQIINDLMPYAGKINKVLICNGILHNESMMPERKLEEMKASQMEAIFHSNTIVPMLWLSRLIPILQGKEATQVALFSARIGSISDNKTGGWYSYRASKAALNMLVQTSSIEYARRAKNVKLIAFHPGTTDTPLSKPFQRSVPKDKLFSAEFVATQLLSIMTNITMDNKAAYLDWNNQTIEW